MNTIVCFEIDAGASMAGSKLHDGNEITDSYLEFEPISNQYRFGAIDVDEGIPYISKDKKEWTIALAYEMEGRHINPLDLVKFVQSKIKEEAV